MAAAGRPLADVDHVVFHEKPFLKFERLLETYLAVAPRGMTSFVKAMPSWLQEKLFLKSVLLRELNEHAGGFPHGERLLFAEHHESHAASAFYPSPFDRAVVLTVDGVGEWTTASVAIGEGADIEIKRELRFPHSLGLLYSAFTTFLGFEVNEGEYKVMGLAPYGQPRFKDLILEHLVDLKEDGSFRLNMDYFGYCTGLSMTNRRFAKLIGLPPRQTEHDPITEDHKDLAASIQDVTEDILSRMARHLAAEFALPNLCLAGGVALNCVAVSKIRREGFFRNVWVQPAAGDAGGALGAALLAYHRAVGGEGVTRTRRRVGGKGDGMRGALLGPSYATADIVSRLSRLGASISVMENEEELVGFVADALAGGMVVGWFQGRAEFGPRSLGARSILADPRSPAMRDRVNALVKHRESFRPFAPVVLREDLSNWFDLHEDSPHMNTVAKVRSNQRASEQASPRGTPIPAVTHIDGSARIQTVRATENPRLHALLRAFKARTDCPVLLNTSFNVRGEPIVLSPEDAWRCFSSTDIDLLVCERAVIRKPGGHPPHSARNS
jgi:carbamoyltransferase